VDSVTSRIPAEDDRAESRNAALACAVARVEASLDVACAPVSQPILVVFSGVPGSGKTYLARRVQARLAAAVIETDRVRRILFHRPQYSGSENGWVYTVCHELIARLLNRRQAVIFDATNLVERHREVLYKIAGQAQARLVIVHTVAPDDVIRARLTMRLMAPDPGNHSDADVAVYETLRKTEQPIGRPHLVIDTTGDCEQAVRRILHECRG
jgi:hypothetical protein